MAKGTRKAPIKNLQRGDMSRKATKPSQPKYKSSRAAVTGGKEKQRRGGRYG